MEPERKLARDAAAWIDDVESPTRARNHGICPDEEGGFGGEGDRLRGGSSGARRGELVQRRNAPRHAAQERAREPIVSPEPRLRFLRVALAEIGRWERRERFHLHACRGRPSGCRSGRRRGGRQRAAAR